MKQFSERCQSYVEPHELELKVEYCLTINPSKRFTNPLEFKRQIGQYLYDNILGIEYRFYVERSKKGKYHVHGTVWFDKYDNVNRFYDFLQKMEEDGNMGYKFGDMMDVIEEVTDEELEFDEKEVLPEEKDEKQIVQKEPPTWEKYCSKQQEYWASLEFKSKFTHKYNPNIVCDFVTTQKKQNKKKKTVNPKKKITNAELQEQINNILRDKNKSDEDAKVI